MTGVSQRVPVLPKQKRRPSELPKPEGRDKSMLKGKDLKRCGNLRE
jgi:hypothetical protein